MNIRFAELPKDLPFVLTPGGDLVINSAKINDFEENYMAKLEDYYSEAN